MTDAMDDDMLEVLLCELTPEDIDAIEDGESLHFEYDGALIEKNPTVVVEAVE